MKHLYLGIDTSNYKTSVAITDENDRIVFERSEYLEVEQGERGLRQSVAFFKQSNALPLFIKEAMETVDPQEIAAIAVSSRPRRVEGSYMPVFLAGLNAASMIGASLNIPVYEFSHQEGHAHAVLTSSGRQIPERCLMYHLSGGTTEILDCKRDNAGYAMEIIGGTKDISFGQLLDRVGVKLGYAFPSGAYLDEVAAEADSSEKAPRIKHIDGYFNLSGIETSAMRRIDKENEEGISHDSLISVLFRQIADLISSTASHLADKTKVKDIYISGGVAASSTIRELIARNHNPDINIIWGDNRLSGDNAVGTARLGRLIQSQKDM